MKRKECRWGGGASFSLRTLMIGAKLQLTACPEKPQPACPEEMSLLLASASPMRWGDAGYKWSEHQQVGSRDGM